MKLKRNIYVVSMLLATIAVSILMGCSTKKNTAFNRWRHSFNTRYNIYYNGQLAYIDASLEKESGNKDNFTELIPLYTVGNKSSKELGKSNYEKAIEKCEKAIKLHSIKRKPEWTKSRKKTQKDFDWLSRREYNPFIWKAWMMMGKSQFYKGEFEASAATFSYMTRMYTTSQPSINSQARAWLAKSYVEQEQLYDAADVIKNMERDSIHRSAVKEWNYTYADYYIHSKEYAKAIPYLQKVIKKERRRKQKAREWYLLGQLYKRLGNNSEAYRSFRHTIGLNPPYQLEFNARISMTEVIDASQSRKMISRLKRMARNNNNKDYLDQVYYAMGNIYLACKDTVNAIASYEKGNVKSTRNGVEKGVLLLTLGNLYWDMERYSDAGRCYGEAIGLLDKERDDYEELSDRSKKLDELVPYTESIHLQDSLQALAKMDSISRNKAIDRVIEALIKKEKEEKRKQQEAEAEKTIAKNEANNPNQRAKTTNPTIANPQDKGKWYFYNQQAVQQGKQTFLRQWGKRKNEDHWNRLNHTVVDFSTEDGDQPDSLSGEPRDSLSTDSLSALGSKPSDEKADSAQNDPHKREFYLAQIPLTEEQLAASNETLQDALFHAGVIFKDKLNNLPLSQKELSRLENNFPDFAQMDEVFYHEFLLLSRLGRHEEAALYVDKLKEKFPDSKWTALLSDPHFVENQKFGVHMEDSLYASTYNAFRADKTQEVFANARISEERFPLGANRDKFVFITGLSKLNDGDAKGCLEDMEKVVKDYPESKLAEMAGMIVNGVKKGRSLKGGRFDLGDVWSRRSAVLNGDDSTQVKAFSPEKNADFVFMIAYEPDSVNENKLLFELAKYNFTSYLVRMFDLQIEDMEGLRMMVVSGFRNYDEALEYAQQFYKQDNLRQNLGKSRTYVISKDNKALLGNGLSFVDYDEFYDKNFSQFREGTKTEGRLLDQAEPTSTELDDGGSAPASLDLNPPVPVEQPKAAPEQGETTPVQSAAAVEQPSGDSEVYEDDSAPQTDDNDYDFEIEGF